jgi:hypothetical protein
MAKQKVEAPKEQVRFSDLTPEGRQAAEKIVSDFGTKVPEIMAKTAESKRKSAVRARSIGTPSQLSNAKIYEGTAKRLEKAIPDAPNAPITLEGAANRRVAAVESAAKTHRTPDEPIGGSGFYFNSNKELSGKTPTHTDALITASSVLSQGATVRDERAAALAIDAAHQSNAKIHMHPALADSLKEHSGVEVPSHLVGKDVSVHDVPSHIFAAMADPVHRALAQTHARGINFKNISKGASADNIKKATDIIRSPETAAYAQNPLSSAKTSSYTGNISEAIPGTPEHHEYNLRAAHLGAAIRGEIHGSQQMFDFYGLRHNSEGVLSSTAHTAEDSWMNALTVGHPDPKITKAGGDIKPTAKAAMIDGKKVSAHPSAEVGAPAIYHAFGNAATSLASNKLQEKYQTEFNVPNMLTQETAWRGVRAGAGRDHELNKKLRESAPAKPAKQKKPKQEELF